MEEPTFTKVRARFSRKGTQVVAHKRGAGSGKKKKKEEKEASTGGFKGKRNPRANLLEKRAQPDGEKGGSEKEKGLLV